jgi:hypothetical protein
MYKGVERRKLKHLRSIINGSVPTVKKALIKMSRMLGPDRLAEIDCELSEVGSSSNKPILEKIQRHERGTD